MEISLSTVRLPSWSSFSISQQFYLNCYWRTALPELLLRVSRGCSKELKKTTQHQCAILVRRYYSRQQQRLSEPSRMRPNLFFNNLSYLSQGCSNLRLTRCICTLSEKKITMKQQHRQADSALSEHWSRHMPDFPNKQLLKVSGLP